MEGGGAGEPRPAPVLEPPRGSFVGGLLDGGGVFSHLGQRRGYKVRKKGTYRSLRPFARWRRLDLSGMVGDW